MGGSSWVKGQCHTGQMLVKGHCYTCMCASKESVKMVGLLCWVTVGTMLLY